MPFGKRPRNAGAARIARLAATLALPILVVTGIGHRFGVVTSGAVLPLITLGYTLALIAVTGSVLALVWIWVTGERGVGQALAAILVSLPVLAALGLFVYGLYRYPAMSDISTDLDRPLLFWAQDRPAGSNQPDTDRAAQAAAYPEISGRLYPVGIERVFVEMETAVRRRHWAVTLRLPPLGPGGFARIEATAKTLIFGFSDHIAVQARTAPDGTRVDVRSASHMGRHDVGQNARRIASFLTELDSLLQGVQEETDQPAAPEVAESS